MTLNLRPSCLHASHELWDYRCTPPCPAHATLGVKSRAPGIPGKRSANQATCLVIYFLLKVFYFYHLHSFRSSLISSGRTWFWTYKSYICFARFISRYFIFLWKTINANVFVIWVSSLFIPFLGNSLLIIIEAFCVCVVVTFKPLSWNSSIRFFSFSICWFSNFLHVFLACHVTSEALFCLACIQAIWILEWTPVSFWVSKGPCLSAFLFPFIPSILS